MIFGKIKYKIQNLKLILLSLLVLSAGCGKLNPYRIAERSVARYLRDELGPAERYRVRIDRKGTDLYGGSLSHIAVSADELRTSSGFLVKRLDADLYGVRFDRKSKALRSVERSAFTASITEQAANAYLEKNDRGVPGLVVEFEPGVIVVKATPTVLGVAIPVTLRGRGAVEAGNQIRFLPDALAISRLNLPQAAVRIVEQRANPVFDLDDMKLPAQLGGVESREGELILSGEVRLPMNP